MNKRQSSENWIKCLASFHCSALRQTIAFDLALVKTPSDEMYKIQDVQQPRRQHVLHFDRLKLCSALPSIPLAVPSDVETTSHDAGDCPINHKSSECPVN